MQRVVYDHCCSVIVVVVLLNDERCFDEKKNIKEFKFRAVILIKEFCNKIIFRML